MLGTCLLSRQFSASYAALQAEVNTTLVLPVERLFGFGPGTNTANGQPGSTASAFRSIEPFRQALSSLREYANVNVASERAGITYTVACRCPAGIRRGWRRILTRGDSEQEEEILVPGGIAVVLQQTQREDGKSAACSDNQQKPGERRVRDGGIADAAARKSIGRAC